MYKLIITLLFAMLMIARTGCGETMLADSPPMGEGTTPLAGEISWVHGMQERDIIYAFNNNRQIAGSFYKKPDNITFRVSPDGARKICPLVPEPGTSYHSQPQAINSRGDVLLFKAAQSAPGAFKNYIWLASGEIRLNGALPGNQQYNVTDFNDSLQVIGTGWRDDIIYSGFLWGADGKVTTLPGFSALDQITARFINNAGHVLGTINEKLVRWNSDKSIFTIPIPSSYTPGAGKDFNDKDQVLGMLHQCGQAVAVRWEADGRMTDLGRLAGDNGEYNYTPVAMNNAGIVIGFASRPGLPDQPFLWTQGGGMQLLTGADNNQMLTVSAINDLGEVIGTCSQKEPGTNNQFAIWTPK